MKITGEGHWDGDPERYCSEVRVVANGWDEAKTLAALFRVLGNPETRAELLAAAKDIDERTEALAAEAGHRRDLLTAWPREGVPMPTDLTRLYRDPHYRMPSYRLIERFAITLPDGTVWTGSSWAPLGETNRGGKARRIQVHDAKGVELFDTDDAFDLANARNGLERWLAERVKEHTPTAAGFAGAGAGI